jgi:hypothetical protein
LAIRNRKTVQLEQRLNGLVDLLRASGELKGLPQPRDGEGEETAGGEVPSQAGSGIPVEDGEWNLSDFLPSFLPPVAHQNNDLGSVDVGREVGGTPVPSGSGATRTIPIPIREDTLRPRNERGGEHHQLGSGQGMINVPTTYNSCAPPTCICRTAGGEIPEPPPCDAAALATYRTEFAPLFPFVVVPADVDAGEFVRTRPVLSAAIRAATSLRRTRSLHAQIYRLMTYFSEHMLLRSERTLDLLQGLIVTLGWYHYHCVMHGQMSNLVHLAMSLVTDMGLNRPPLLQERTHVLVLFPREPPPRTHEQRRALLGVWYLSSV